METVAKKKLYEGMFLVDSAEAASDWDGIIGAIKKILDRAEAEIVSFKKWDDRRLAYDIRRTARGTYILSYFRVDGKQIQGIEKGVQLSEKILRVLILSADHMTAEDIDKDTPATKVETEKEKPSPAREPVAEAKTEPADAQQEVQTKEETRVAEEPEAVKEAETVDDAETVKEAETVDEAETVTESGAREDTGTTEETETAKETGQAEQTEEEAEESRPKPVADD